MDRKTEQRLIRLLVGELSDEAAQNLRLRLENESDLQHAFTALQERWQTLEPPPLEAVHPSFTSRVVRQAGLESSIEAASLGRSSPLWARATAAVALAGGILVGALLASPSATDEWADWNTIEQTQAEVYWETLSASSDDLVQEELR